MGVRQIKVLIMYLWSGLIEQVLRNGPYIDIVVPRYAINHPLNDGFEETLGEFQGQTNDYELTLSDGRRIHIREFHDCYKVHWDKVSPKIDPFEHLRKDAPFWWALLAGAFGVTLGYSGSKNMDDAIAGMFFGFFVGVLTTSE